MLTRWQDRLAHTAKRRKVAGKSDGPSFAETLQKLKEDAEAAGGESMLAELHVQC